MEEATPKCVDILVGLIGSKATYAVEESVCVLCDVLRRYPGQFESVLGNVCANLEQLKDSRARAAAVWILGEYSGLIEGIDVLLDPFLDTFGDEEPLVQLSILSATVKVFCEKGEAVSDQLHFVLKAATRAGSVPDVKNRALVYWRILSSDVGLVKEMLRFSKQAVAHSGLNFEPGVLTELIRNMGSVSGVLHVVPSDFVRRVRFVPEDEGGGEAGALRSWHRVRLSESSALDVFADFERGRMFWRMVNKGGPGLSGFALAMNKNAIGLSVAGDVDFPAGLEPGDVQEVVVPLRIDAAAAGNFDTPELQIALRTSAGTVYARDDIPGQIATGPEGKIDQAEFRRLFQVHAAVLNTRVEDAAVADEPELNAANVFVVGRNGPKTYVSFGIRGQIFVGELNQEKDSIVVNVKGESQQLFPVIQVSARALFAKK
jgi:hypothetical protein